MYDKVTLFYLKSNGNIKGFCTGEQSLDYFGEEKEIYSKIFKCIVIDFDEKIINNLDNYRVVKGKLELKEV